MPGEAYSPSGTFPTFPLTLVKDGEVYNFNSIMVGLFKPIIDGIGWAKLSIALPTPAGPISGWNSGNPVSISASTNVTSTTFVNLSGSSYLSKDMLTGDTILLFATVMGSVDSAGHFGYLRIGDADNSIAVPGAYAVISDDAMAQVVTLVGLYTAPADATYDFHVMACVSAGTLTAPQIVSVVGVVFKA
jgi:hypothetical protein